MKVKYTGPKAKASVPLPIGTRRVTKEYIYFMHGEVKELPDEQAKALFAINPYYCEVSDTGTTEVEAVTLSNLPVQAVQPSSVAPIEAPKRRGRPKKVQ